MTPAARSLLLLAVPVLLSACAMGKRDFDCPGMPDGAICKSPQEVYRLTNNADHLNPDGDPSAANKSTQAASVAASALLPKRLLEPIAQPLPVLEPAVTMRAWIAPWIDRRGDLHFPSLLFTEVTSRRWAIGEATGRDARILVPMAVEGGSGGDRLLRDGRDDEPSGGLGDSGRPPTVPSLPSSLPAK